MPRELVKNGPVGFRTSAAPADNKAITAAHNAVDNLLPDKLIHLRDFTHSYSSFSGKGSCKKRQMCCKNCYKGNFRVAIAPNIATLAENDYKVVMPVTVYRSTIIINYL